MDLKLTFFEIFPIFLNSILTFFEWIVNLLFATNQNGFFFFNWKVYYEFCQNMSFIFSIKFFLCISLLILIRGGAPRYRYDFLTKIGWLKFIGMSLFLFFFCLFFFFTF